MRLSFLFLFAVLLFSFGCIEEKDFPSEGYEQLSDTQSTDIDGDGIDDYTIYMFNAVQINDANLEVQREITVTTITNATYTEINPNLTDIDLLIADQSLEEFSQTKTQADTACSSNIGLLSVVCSDVTTCGKLCAGNSFKCAKIVENYEDEIGGAMISYVQANNEIRSQLLDSRRMIFDLREGTDEERNEFLGKTRIIISKIADINANPIYSYPGFDLCSHSDFGVSYLTDAAEKIGTYETEVSSYHYRIILSLTPLEVDENEGVGMEVGAVGIVDEIPTAVVSDADMISAIQKFTAEKEGAQVKVLWNSEKPSEEGYIFVYEFTSEQPPEALLSSVKSPELSVRTINLSGLDPTNSLFLMLNNILQNYYLALGAAIGITISVLFVIYNIIILLFTILSEKMAGASLTTGFRKAFGRTDVRWKTDLIITILFLAIGFYVAAFVAASPLTTPPLLESVDFLLKNGMGATGVILIAFGVLMGYFTIENLAKITMLEKAYGMVLKDEKQRFAATVENLNKKIEELRELVEKYSEEDFDVSQEYDILTTLKSHKTGKKKDMSASSKVAIEENLARAENAINSLKGRKKLADENWPKWKEMIRKSLDEQNEVYSSSLGTIPASLRAWALGKYMKEEGAEGIMFEHDSLKKVKITPQKLIKEMISSGRITGGVLIKNEKIIASEFAGGSDTVMSALTLKLKSYLHSLAKNLGQKKPQSFVTVGKTEVIVMMKAAGMESVLFLKKGKFNEAIEQWKTKIKMLE